MLVILLVKAVPARTAQVVNVGGVLNREAMQLVLNPYDERGILAADFLRRSVGGKVIAVSMGPSIKLNPIMSVLHDMAILGVDENVILSDSRMAGADTMATSYAVSMGIIKILDNHVKALDELITLVRSSKSEVLADRARELHKANSLANRVYSTLPAVKNTIIGDFLGGLKNKKTTLKLLENQITSVNRFVVVAGLRSTDGETGSVGPQVAESLSNELGISIPHITNVHDLDIDPDSLRVMAERNVGEDQQKLESQLPLVITISPDFKTKVIPASNSRSVRENSYLGRVYTPSIWDGGAIGAKAELIGLVGSPTIVGPGIETGRAQTQKILNSSLVFLKPGGEVSAAGRNLGPFSVGDNADDLPAEIKRDLLERSVIGVFGYPRLIGELFDPQEK
ncbi:MAG: electron transfer flavoprotein subunit beta/FixA family protein [Nitrososphaerales archaeon]